LDGDEVTAITYAVDEMARGLGVVADLPCLVILDALPNQQFDILRLDSYSTERLIPLLRRASAKLREPSTYGRYRQLVRRIADLEQEAEAQRQDLQLLNVTLQRLQVPDEHSPSGVLNLLRNHLLSASTRQFRGAVKNLPVASIEQLSAVRELATSKHELLVAYARSLYVLRKLEREYVDSNESVSKRYDSICEQYIRPLLGADFPNNGNSISGIGEVLDELSRRQNTEVNLIMTHLPSGSEIEMHVSAERARRLQSQFQHMSEKRNEVARLEGEILLNLRVLADLKHPSLSSVFSAIAQEARLKTLRRSVQTQASNFLGSVFKPETLMKFLQVLPGSPS
jgi:hypothetical protein